MLSPLGEVSQEHKLALLILYMRRIHAFDYLSCTQHASQMDLVASDGEAYLFEGLMIHFHQRQPYAWRVEHAGTLLPAEAHLRMLGELSRLDEEGVEKAAEAAEAFYTANTVEEVVGKYRCPLSNKLFKDAVYVRKHIDNKFAELLEEAKARALEEKYFQYFLADENRLASSSPPPARPPPPQPRRESFGKGRCSACSRDGDGRGQEEIWR